MSNQEDIQRLESKMEKLFDDVLGRKDGLVKTASPSGYMVNTSYKTYKSSFLTLGDMQIPDDYRKIFRWCRYFFKFDSIIGAAVRSMATFPITEYILNDTQDAEETDTSDESSSQYKFFDKLFKELNLYNHLIEIGYDYFLYGNCVIFAEPGVKTVRYRDELGEIKEKKEVVWKSLERLDLTRLRIDRDPQTKEKVYYYDIPPELKRVIQTKKPLEKYNKIPKIFKEAVAKKGLVKLKSNFVYHLAMPSESGDSGLWATPPVLHAMKLIMYTNILRQAQEAIAYEHIIPRRVYYFQNSQEYAPDFDFTRIADDFAFELRKQLNDPNYQVISPIPVQQIQHGGNGRALLLVPEIEQLQNTILAAMGVPREFIFGGVSYSGSTTSLRILENHFITYRILLDQYVNQFLIKRLAEIRGEWEVDEDDDSLVHVTFSDLKMQDDIQQKQLMIQLNSQGKLPDEVLYEEVFGLDAEKVVDQLFNEQKRKLDEQFQLQLYQMELQTQMQQEMVRRGITPPQPAVDEQGNPVDPAADPNAQGQPSAQPDQGQLSQGQPQEQTNGQVSQQELFKIAQAMLNMTDAEKANVISKLPREQAQRIMIYLEQLKMQDEGAEQVDMRPMPEKLPPRREGGV